VGVVRALVIGNADDLDPGFVGHRLRQRGYLLTEGQREHAEQWPALDGFDLVLTLGSEWNVGRPETAAPVAAEAALVRGVVRRDIPLLAICFGAQVLSHALGGTVSQTPTPEIGWYDVAVTGAPIAAGPWMEWHVDVFTPPEGFDVVATTAVGPQLVTGRRCVGTQFHPEATETMVRRWILEGGGADYRARGGDPDELLATTRANVARSRPAAEDLVDWFLDDVARR
jgi:GMP synthase-like glutamine amidotransferase